MSLAEFHVFNRTCNIVVLEEARVLLLEGDEVLWFVKSQLILLLCSRMCRIPGILTVWNAILFGEIRDSDYSHVTMLRIQRCHAL